jgi:Ca2+-binding RTX toxin-like protein
MRAFRTLALALTLAAGALGSSDAVASTVLTDSGKLIYRADAGEENRLTVSLVAGTYTITDTGASLLVGPNCTQAGPNGATCPSAGITSIDVALGDLLDGTLGMPSTRAVVQGGPDNDTLRGGAGPDQLHGQEGDDLLVGGAGDDELVGEELLSTTTGRNDLDGGPGNDRLTGGAGIDSVQGAAGNDTLSGLAGGDVLDGGDDTDDVSGGDGNDVLRGGTGNDRVGDTSISVLGIAPERGDDLLDGGTGDDVLQPGAGPEPGFSDNDTLNGSGGRDRVTYEQRTQRVEVSLDSVSDDGSFGERDNVAGDVEQLTGGRAGDLLVGGPGNDAIDGSAGPDTIQGAAGADTLDGGAIDAESDNVNGGDGDDRVIGNAGDDALDGGAGSDTVEGGGGTDQSSGGEGDDKVSGGAGTDQVSGGPGNDDVDGAAIGFVGADGADILSGDSGVDSLHGRDGDDRMAGGPDSDTLSGGVGRDNVDYAYASGTNVTVRLDRGRGRSSEPGDVDTIVEVEDVSGGSQRDTVTGSRERNRLDGATGEDYVDGGRGVDRLDGGSNADVVAARDSSRDGRVSCGPGQDLAIVDPRDRIARGRNRCEQVDDGSQTKPKPGRVYVDPQRCGGPEDDVGLGLPAMHRLVPLRYPVMLKGGYRRRAAPTLDATDCAIRLTATPGRGRSASAELSDGAVDVDQTSGRRVATVLTVERPRCGAAAAGTAGAAARRRGLRLKTGRRRHRWRVRGRYSTGASFGTDWRTVERCSSTTTIVRRGRVRVFDRTRRRTVTVTAGHQYRARRRSSG